MSEPEKFLRDFLSRWSSRKATARDTRDSAQDSPARAAPTEASPTETDPATSAAALPTEALPTKVGQELPPALPPIESISASTDVRAYLATGVAPELAREALRRAWATDPAIRDFVGIAENQGDFTEPDGVLGFGPLENTEALRRMIAELAGEAEPQSPQQPMQDSAPAAGATTEAVDFQEPRSNENAAPQDAPAAVADHGEAAAKIAVVRRHGGAIPKS